MPKKAQAKFSKRVKVALIFTDTTVTALAKKLGRPRSTVSRAIHGAPFPDVLGEIAQELNIHD